MRLESVRLYNCDCAVPEVRAAQGSSFQNGQEASATHLWRCVKPNTYYLEHIDIPTTLVLAIMATLGYVFGTINQRR